MSKRLVAGITVALVAALAGCQAPAATTQSQMVMRQLPKASKVVTDATKGALGTLKTVVKGNFGTKSRSVLFVAADVEQLTIRLVDTTDPTREYNDTLVKADGDFGGSTAVSTITGIFPATYQIQVSALDLNGTQIGGNETFDTVTITSGVTAEAPITVQLAPTAPGSLNTNITLVDGD